MKTSKTAGGTGRIALRGLLVVGVAVSLSGCGMFGWIGSRFSSDKNEGASAPPAAQAPAATSTLGAADPSDPVPREEPLHPTANKWYGSNGRLYRPIIDDRAFKERGKAAVMGADQEGKPTASGESFTPRGMTAAHPTLPIPSYARVTDLRTGKTAIVRVNDRGAYERDEAIAISAAVAQKIGLANNDEVEVERITPAEVAALPSTRLANAAPPALPAPGPAPAPGPVAVASPQAPPPAPVATPLPPPQPVETSTPIPVPVAPAAPRPAPAPAPVAGAPAAPVAAARAPSAAPPPPSRAAAPAPKRAPRGQSPNLGRWSVQIASFATDPMAESTRERIAKRLAQQAPNLAATPRVERYGNRFYVLVGDFPDRDSAEALAGRLRGALLQDVVVDKH
jgi:rare lipoprotein A